MGPLKLQPDELLAFLENVFGETWHNYRLAILSVEVGRGLFRFVPQEMHSRPGNTLSGPAMFTFADVGAYALINAHTGPKPLTVTTSLNINFMRKPEMSPVLGTFELLKLGKRLAIVRATMANEATPDQIVADASATYAIEQ
jgi:acyl-coenzyme A thioesterase PaaI-like protein